MQQNVAKTGWELTKVARIGRSRSVCGQKRVEGGVGQSREPKFSVCCLHTSAHPFLAKNRPGAPVFGHCPFLFYGRWPIGIHRSLFYDDWTIVFNDHFSTIIGRLRSNTAIPTIAGLMVFTIRFLRWLADRV